MLHNKFFWLYGLALLALFPADNLQAQSVDKQTGIVKWSGEGLKFELAAMSHDLVRAFFIGRGFTPANADFIAATGCIFRSAIGNSGAKTDDPTITVELAKWSVIVNNQQQSPRTREDWGKFWETKVVSNAAKVAFHWALFPTRQTYLPTDYNWGMISFALPRATKFDLKIHWQKNGHEQTRIITNLECGK